MTEHGREHTDGSRSGDQPVFITRKAHTAVHEVLAEWRIEFDNATTQQLIAATTEALCRAIEQHEDFKQEVSDAVGHVIKNLGGHHWMQNHLSRFIIPASKPDPLVELVKDLYLSDEYADRIRAALDALGLEIREKGQ